MKMKERLEAIRMRAKGSTLKEISMKLNVSKSTASLWVRDVELTKEAKNILEKKRCVNLIYLTKEYKNIGSYGKLRRIRMNKEAESILGSCCYFCKKTYYLVYHRKDGKKHDTNLTSQLVIKNPDDFVRLCRYCHTGVHFCMNWFHMNWYTIEKEIIKTKQEASLAQR